MGKQLVCVSVLGVGATGRSYYIHILKILSAEVKVGEWEAKVKTLLLDGCSQLEFISEKLGPSGSSWGLTEIACACERFTWVTLGELAERYIAECVCVTAGHWRGNNTRANCFQPAYCRRQSLFLRNVAHDYGPPSSTCSAEPAAAPLALPYMCTPFLDETLMQNI